MAARDIPRGLAVSRVSQAGRELVVWLPGMNQAQHSQAPRGNVDPGTSQVLAPRGVLLVPMVSNLVDSADNASQPDARKSFGSGRVDTPTGPHPRHLWTPESPEAGRWQGGGMPAEIWDSAVTLTLTCPHCGRCR